MQTMHVNLKGVASGTLAAHRWVHLWSNKRIIIWSGKVTTLASVNRCTSRDPYIMKCLRYMFWLSAIHNFRLTARHIPGVQNVLPDKISRLHECNNKHGLCNLLTASPLEWHISSHSIVRIFCRSYMSST